MFSVRRGDIYHLRGDTGVLLFQPTDETGKAVTDFQATLSVKQDINADDYLLQKICVDGNLISDLRILTAYRPALTSTTSKSILVTTCRQSGRTSIT